jgi:hypothetical protein
MRALNPAGDPPLHRGASACLAAMPFTSTGVYRALRLLAYLLALDGMNALVLNPTSVAIKYVISASLASLMAYCALSYASLTLRPSFPLAFLALSIAGVIGYVAQSGEGVPSYLSALFPMLIAGMAIVIPGARSAIDADEVQETILRTGLLFAAVQVTCQILWRVFPATNDLLRGELPNVEIVHVKTIVFVLAAATAVLARRWRLLVPLLALSAMTLALRPSSIFVAGFTLTVGIAVLLRSRFRWLGLTLGFALILAFLLFPLAFLADPNTAAPFFDLEPYVKVQLLDSASNSSFRITVLKIARADILSHSLWFGQHFGGSEAVYVHDVLPDFDGSVAIHSDPFILIKYAGLFGYSFFAFGMLGAALTAAASLRRAATGSSQSVVFGAMFCSVVALLIYVSYNPMLELYSVTFYVWLIFLVGALAARSQRLHGGARTAPDANAPAKVRAVASMFDGRQAARSERRQRPAAPITQQRCRPTST